MRRRCSVPKMPHSQPYRPYRDHNPRISSSQHVSRSSKKPSLSISTKSTVNQLVESRKTKRLTDLPLELLIQIVSFLPRNSAWLAAVCRVSLLFRKVVEPHLYSTITLTIDCDEKMPDSRTLSRENRNSGGPKFSCLVDTLSKKPWLRKHTRLLGLRTGHCHGVFKGQAGYYPSLRLQLRLMELLPSLQELHLNPPPVFSDFPGMPSLRSLHLDFEANSYLPDLIDLETVMSDTQSAKLRTLRICLAIPNLRMLKIVGLHPLPNRIPPVAFPDFGHRCSPINDLQIVR